MGKPENFDPMAKFRWITTCQTDEERSRRVDVQADPKEAKALAERIEEEVAEAPAIVRDEWLLMISRACAGQKEPQRHLPNLREWLEAQEVLFAEALIKKDRNEAEEDRL